MKKKKPAWIVTAFIQCRIPLFIGIFTVYYYKPVVVGLCILDRTPAAAPAAAPAVGLLLLLLEANFELVVAAVADADASASIFSKADSFKKVPSFAARLSTVVRCLNCIFAAKVSWFLLVIT